MTFALAGATGRFRSLIGVLLERGHRLRVLARDTESPAANELRGAGAEVWRGGFDEPETLVAAAQGADALFAAGRAPPAGAGRAGGRRGAPGGRPPARAG